MISSGREGLAKVFNDDLAGMESIREKVKERRWGLSISRDSGSSFGMISAVWCARHYSSPFSYLDKVCRVMIVFIGGTHSFESLTE